MAWSNWMIIFPPTLMSWRSFATKNFGLINFIARYFSHSSFYGPFGTFFWYSRRAQFILWNRHSLFKYRNPTHPQKQSQWSSLRLHTWQHRGPWCRCLPLQDYSWHICRSHSVRICSDLWLLAKYKIGFNSIDSGSYSILFCLPSDYL